MAYTILKFLPRRYRVQTLASLSKRWKYLSNTSQHWHFLARCIAEENCLYITPRLPAAESWRRVFFRMWKHKNMWKPKVLSQEQQNELDSIHLAGLEDAANAYGSVQQADTNEPDKETEDTGIEDSNMIQVAVRFRPKKNIKVKSDSEDKENDTSNEQLFVLPLHQRLQIIKLRDKCDSTEALKILYAEGGWRPGLQAKWKKKRFDDVDGGDENNEHQLSAAVHTIDPGSGSVIMLVPKIGMRPFTFDHVLSGRASQFAVYETVGRTLVMDFLKDSMQPLLCMASRQRQNLTSSKTICLPSSPNLLLHTNL